MYARVHLQILDSTIAEDWQVRHVFEDLFKLADYKTGIVDMTPASIARRLNIPIDVINHGIEKLSEPDPYSRSQVEEGRRIILLDSHRNWGWRIVNYLEYLKQRNMDSKREADRERQRRKRDAMQPVTLESQPVTLESQPVTLESQPVTLESQPVTLESQPVTLSRAVSRKVAHVDVDVDVKTPSRAKSARAAKSDSSETDPTKTDLANARHADFKAIIGKYWDSTNTLPLPWDGREGKNLGMFLGANPKITAEQFTELLRNRYKSEGVNHAERCSLWIAHATNYARGPLDRYGAPMVVSAKKSALDGMTFFTPNQNAGEAQQ